MRTIIDVDGMKFNHLTIMRRLRGNISKVTTICDCGRKSTKILGNVKNGMTKTCGNTRCKYRN